MSYIVNAQIHFLYLFPVNHMVYHIGTQLAESLVRYKLNKVKNTYKWIVTINSNQNM